MLKLHVFGNNSKTINNIRNLTGEKLSAQQDLTTLKLWKKFDYLSWSYCPFFIKFSNFNTFRFLFQKLEIDVKFKQQTCAACQDVPRLQI
jgi:hypothetical protein